MVTGFRKLGSASEQQPRSPAHRQQRTSRWTALVLTAGWGSLCALTIWSAQAAPPEIYLIERLGSNLVTIHFNTEANRKYQLQFINSYTCPTNLPGNSGVVCNSSGVPINLWSNLYVAPIIPTVSHYVIADTVTNRQRFYRLRVTP